MRPGMLIPLLLLLLCGLGFALVFVVRNQRRKLERRVEAAMPAPPVVATMSQPDRALRRRRSPAERIGMLAKLISMPLDVSLANVVPPGWVFAAALFVAVGSASIGHLLTNWYIGVVEGLLAGFVVLRGVFGWELSSYRAKLVRQLPDAVQLVISATRAGLPVSEAFQAIAQEMAAPTRDEFIRINNELAMGIPADQALLNMHRRTGVTEYAIFAVTIGVQSRSGGRLAETIQNLADTVRERLTIAARARALAGEAKVSAIIMAALPIVAGVLLSIVRPGHLDPLFHDPRGIRMFVFGVTTLVLGALTMRQLIRGATKD